MIKQKNINIVVFILLMSARLVSGQTIGNSDIDREEISERIAAHTTKISGRDKPDALPSHIKLKYAIEDLAINKQQLSNSDRVKVEEYFFKNTEDKKSYLDENLERICSIVEGKTIDDVDVNALALEVEQLDQDESDYDTEQINNLLSSLSREGRNKVEQYAKNEAPKYISTSKTDYAALLEEFPEHYIPMLSRKCKSTNDQDDFTNIIK